MTEQQKYNVDKQKADIKAEALQHGKARSAKVRKLLEVGVERFNKMAAFHQERANKNRVTAEKYYHLFNFLYDTLSPQVEELEKKLLEDLKIGEEVILQEYGISVAKGYNCITFEPLTREDQWVQALRERREEIKNNIV